MVPLYEREEGEVTDDDEEDSMGAEDIGNDGKPMWLRSVSARSLVHDAHI